MYRPPSEPQFRPRAVAVPPPPPPGMVNYALPRPPPPPLHGRPFIMSQFSYSLPAAGPPPLPMTPPRQSFQIHPSSGLQVLPFVPPLPSDLPPPPPSSPPPLPPPLSSESMVGSTKLAGHSAFSPPKTDAPLHDGGYHTSNQQESSLPCKQSVAENQAGHRLDPAKRQLDTGWNATYQDILDEDAGSASDMDMDLEDHLGISTTKAAVDGGLNSGPTCYPPRSNEVKGEEDRSNQEGLGFREGQMNADASIYDATTAGQLKALVSGASGSTKEHQISGANEDKKLEEGHLSPDDVMEPGFVFGYGRSQASMTKESPRARSSRWGSPARVRNKDHDHELLMACSGSWEHPSSSCNTTNDTSRNSQRRYSPDRIVDGSLNSEVPASVERAIDFPTDPPQRPDTANQMTNQSSEIDTRSNAVQRREREDPKVDEFGRLVQEGVSDSESEGHRLRLVQSGRVSRKGGSASNSEDDRHSLKRKRRYSRSRSRSRTSSGSRSRSRSSTGRSRGSRSPTRSTGERRWRRRSFSRSPLRKPRWNRSQSRSPYSRRSYSRSPPRDSRRRGISRGERDWRGDRDYFGRGRRGGRGGGANNCFHYARGRCLRGSACRFLHVRRDSLMQDRGGWRRDDQFDNHSFRDGDGVQESHMIGRQDREKLAREPWSERHDGWDANSPDMMGENQGRENARILPHEVGWDVGGELPADSFTSLTPAEESWAPGESKCAQFMDSCDPREGYGGISLSSIEREVGAAEQAGGNPSKMWSVLDTMDKMDKSNQNEELVAIKADKGDGFEEVGSGSKQGDNDSIQIEKGVVQESDVEVRQDECLGTNGDMDIGDDMKLSPVTGEQGPKQEIYSPHGAVVVPEVYGSYGANVKLEHVDEVDVSKDTSNLGEKAVECAAKADAFIETQVAKGSSLLSKSVKSKEEGPCVVLEEVVEKPTLESTKEMKAELSESLPVGIIAPMEPSCPQAQEISVGHPASRPPGMLPPQVSPLLPTPVVQHNECIGQPVLPQGQQHIPQGQQAIPTNQSHPRQPMGSTQHGMVARNLPHPTPYGSYRSLPSNVFSSDLGDQATGQMAKLNSGNMGCPPVAVGWGQPGFPPRAPGQDIMTFSQAHGRPNYGRPSLEPLPFGDPFFGPPPPPPYNSGDQVTKHHGVPFSQQQRHGVSADAGAPFSQYHLAPQHALAPFPQQHPPSQMHRPPSHVEAPYLPYVHPQPNSIQTPASTQQAGHMHHYVTVPTVSAISQPSLLPAQQGLGSTPSLLPEQPHPSGGATPSEFHAATSSGLPMNPAFSLSVPPPQSTILWSYSAAQVPVPPPTGRSYAYPLTTIPPLSSLVQVPQTTNPPSQSNQYDPLSDIPGSYGSPKGSIKALEVAMAISRGGTSLTEPLNPSKENAQTGETRAPLAAPLGPPMNGADTKITTKAVTDAEILSPESWSPGQPVEGAELGQEQQALSKKGSRGLKMLRAAIAEHVKEVLKPTWKEGYMSKEAFKTIAKKAVEKVIGNVPSHHIPKTQEKVDQYMKASRSKISKLVQGYVDKYLKL